MAVVEPLPAPLLLTMGDGAGIGPEILVKVFAQHQPTDVIVIGDPARLAQAVRQHGDALALWVWGDPPVWKEAASFCAQPPLAEPFLPLKAPMAQALDAAALGHFLAQGRKQAQAYGHAVFMPVLPVGLLPPDLPYGRVDARAGQAAYAAIVCAIRLCQSGAASGMVTAPIHKEALAAAGVPFPGHTEILAHETGTRDFAMVLADEALRVLLVSIHVSLREALAQVTQDTLMARFALAVTACEALGISRPRIAVAGLNPHAGEGCLGARRLRSSPRQLRARKR